MRLRNVGVFEDTTLHLVEETLHAARDCADPEGSPPERLVPRSVVVLFGADGVGKTTLLSALSITRPGYALPPAPRASGSQAAAPDLPATVVTEWQLGEDDPERPHPLVVASPIVMLEGETSEAAGARRREQALFDRRAQSGGGFVFVGFSGARWFSRATSTLSVPEKSLLRYDVRAIASFDDPTRADLARETKQVLAYAGIARALAAGSAEHVHLTRFDVALREVADVMLEPFGFVYAGVSPSTLEPQVRDAGGNATTFDALPRAARHLVAIGTLSLRALFAAYPGAGDPRDGEGVVAVDDVDSQQDPAMLRGLVPLLRRALPNVQWILTTGSPQLAMACAPGEVIALRKASRAASVEIGDGLWH